MEDHGNTYLMKRIEQLEKEKAMLVEALKHIETLNRVGPYESVKAPGIAKAVLSKLGGGE